MQRINLLQWLESRVTLPKSSSWKTSSDRLRRWKLSVSLQEVSAHDLNNMLSPILGYAEIILSDMQDNNPQYESNVMQIKSAAERARNLTHELLAFSRKQVLEMKVLDLAEVVASYGKMLRRTIREDIEIQIRQNLSKG